MQRQAAGINDDVLHAALEGLEARKQSIERQIEQVRSMLGIGQDRQKRRGRPPKSAAANAGETSMLERAPRKRRKLGAEARARISAAQSKRWAAKKGSTEEPAKSVAAPTKKRKLSAAGRKRIIEATKKRWAAYNAKKAASQ